MAAGSSADDEARSRNASTTAPANLPCNGGGGSGGATQHLSELQPSSSSCAECKLVWRRRQTEHPSTEDALRALLNKLAPSRVLACLASKVAGHLIEDEAPDQLARQLVERVQAETLFASTYAKLCSELVRVRGGFVFYKHLMTRCRATFSSSVRVLIVAPDSHLQQVGPCSDAHRHRLRALTVFVCHLFLEGLLSFDQLHQDHLQQLEGHLPDRVAIECLCSALTVAGHKLEDQRPHWLQDVLRQMQDAAPGLRQERNLRLTFMVRDLVELHQRNWQQREPQLPSSPIEHAEP